jgi:hypothetical protein
MAIPIRSIPFVATKTVAILPRNNKRITPINGEKTTGSNTGLLMTCRMEVNG